MTRRANSRLAGSAYLLYIALGIPSLILTSKASNAEGTTAQLALIAQHTTDVRIAVLLILFSGFCALALGVSLWAITRDEDPDLAMLGLAFRVGEGIVGALSTHAWLALLWLTTSGGAKTLSAEARQALGAYLLHGQGSAALFFAFGGLIFSWLLLRGRMIPSGLAWLGVVASVLWVVVLPLQAIGIAKNSILQMITWIPMAAYEIPLAFWLIFVGARPPARLREGVRSFVAA